jgi:hypothetical protein
LQCNLKRGRMDSKRFKMGKEILKFTRKDYNI